MGNPINLMSGNKFQKETDFSLPGASLMLNRMFNSANADNNIGLGQGWHHSYAVSLYDAGNGTRDIVQSNGSRLNFDAVQFSDVGSTGSSNLPSDNVGNPIQLKGGPAFQATKKGNQQWH